MYERGGGVCIYVYIHIYIYIYVCTWQAMRRLRARSGTICVFEAAKAEFFEKLRRSQVPEDVIGWINVQTCYSRPYDATQHSGWQKSRPPCTWQPLTYHPIFACALSRALREFLASHESKTLLAEAFERNCDIDMRFAWKLPGTAFGNSLVAW